MNTYETAPATQMLATTCIMCGRPLLDAVSVEAGVGPTCREKYGYNEGPTAKRAEANRLVHMIATGNKSGASIADCILRIHNFGFVKLADTIADRLAEIRITETDGRYVVVAPYKSEAINAFRGIEGKRFDAATKAWTFPVAAKRALWNVLRKFYTDTLAVGGKGPFYIATI